MCKAYFAPAGLTRYSVVGAFLVPGAFEYMSRTQPGPTAAHGTVAAVVVAVALVPAAATAVPSAPPPSTTDALIPAITAILVRRLTLLNIEHPFA